MLYDLKTKTTAQLDAVQLLMRKALSSDRTAVGGEMTRLMNQLEPAGADAPSKKRGVLYTLCFSRLKRWHMSLPHFHKSTLDWMSVAKKARFLRWLERRDGLVWIQSLASEGESNGLTWKTRLATASRFIKGGADGSPTAIVQDIVSRALKSSPELEKAMAGSNWTILDPTTSSESLGEAEMVVIFLFSKPASAGSSTSLERLRASSTTPSPDDAAPSAKR